MYAVATHVGPYDGIPNAWTEMMGKWMPSSRYAFRCESPCLELYIDDCATVPMAEVRTEICVPIKPPAG